MIVKTEDKLPFVIPIRFMTEFEDKFFSLAKDLLVMMKEYNFFMVSWLPPPSPYSLVKNEKMVDMVRKEQLRPEHQILSDQEILSNCEALNYLFSWGVELVLPEDD